MTAPLGPLILRRLRVPALVAAAGGLSIAFELSVAGLVVVGLALGLAGHALAAAIVPSRSPLDWLLGTVTFAAAAFVVVAEALSQASLLGSTSAWIAASITCGIAVPLLLGGRCTRQRPRPPSALLRSVLGPPPPGAGSLLLAVRALVWLLLVAVGLHLATVFVLAWFSGVNVFDTISHYLPRSIRMVQHGHFGGYDTYYDFMQYLHPALVAVQLLFVRSDVLVNPMSFVSAGLTCLTVFALARSLGWPAPYPLFAALVPTTMPLFLLHMSTTNFDTFIALWLAQALYYLRRGFATSRPGWLMAAGVATALAFAAKPTVWFAVPGLGLLWLATVARAALRRRLGRALPALAVCAVVFVAVGTPFLIRNLISQGYLIAPPQWQSFQVGGGAGGLEHRVRLLGYNTFALGLQLLTPPFLLPSSVANGLDPWFAARAAALGYRLPDPSISAEATLAGEIRHVSHRYDSNHASYGAAFVLVVLPALLALPFARRRLGARWVYAAALACFGLSYFVTMNVLSIYSVNNTRYLIEMMAALAALAPTLFVVLPSRVGGTLALGIAALLVLEMHDVVVHNKQTPFAVVTRVPRMEQYYVVNGNPPTPARAAALLDQKYPPDQLPDLYIEDTGTPSFPDYTFLGPSLQRRTHYLRPPASPADLPGPYITRDRGLAERLIATGQVVGDQLSVDFWVLFPNDRPRVLFWSVRSPTTNQVQLRLQAVVPPGAYRAPRFGFVLRTVRGEERLRGFEPSPVIEVPMETAARGTIQVEIRDGDDERRVERIRVERPRFMGI